MKNHIFTIILLILAGVAFALRFFVSEDWLNYCGVAAFALPTLAAVVEIIVSERSGKETDKQIKKLKEKQLSVRVEDKMDRKTKWKNGKMNT